MKNVGLYQIRQYNGFPSLCLFLRPYTAAMKKC